MLEGSLLQCVKSSFPRGNSKDSTDLRGLFFLCRYFGCDKFSVHLRAGPSWDHCVESMLNLKGVVKEPGIGELPEGAITGRHELHLGFVFIAVIKKMAKSILGRKVFIWLTYPRSQSTKGSQGRSSRPEPVGKN